MIPEHWARLHTQSKPVLTKFFNNIRFLMDERGISLRDMKEDIFKRYGYTVSTVAIQQFRNEQHKVASTNYLAIYSLYFGEPMDKLCYIDYREEARKTAERKAKHRRKVA